MKIQKLKNLKVVYVAHVSNTIAALLLLGGILLAVGTVLTKVTFGNAVLLAFTLMSAYYTTYAALQPYVGGKKREYYSHGVSALTALALIFLPPLLDNILLGALLLGWVFGGWSEVRSMAQKLVDPPSEANSTSPKDVEEVTAAPGADATSSTPAVPGASYTIPGVGSVVDSPEALMLDNLSGPGIEASNFDQVASALKRAQAEGDELPNYDDANED